MRFISWLKEQTKRTDQVGDFAKWAVRPNTKFTLSSDPDIIKAFIALKKPNFYDAFALAFKEYFADPRMQVPKSFYKKLDNISDQFFQ